MSIGKNKKNNIVKEETSMKERPDKQKATVAKQNKKIEEKFMKEIAELNEKLDILEDEKLRALAELENIRRRMQKEKEDNAKYGASDIARDLFVIIDNIDRAIISSPKKLKDNADIERKYSTLHEGLELIQKEINSLLKRHGIEIINPQLGDGFDPNIHQAMMEVPSENYEPGKVCEVLQTGYSIHERLLRPAMVGVSKSQN